MTWSKIVGVLKRLDSRLSDAVYLHGCYLTRQEMIVRHHLATYNAEQVTDAIECQVDTWLP